jgi:hypothetical protein
MKWSGFGSRRRPRSARRGEGLQVNRHFAGRPARRRDAALQPPGSDHAEPTPSRVDATIMARTSAAMRAKSRSSLNRNHTAIVATRTGGSAISSTIPVETKYALPGRRLAPRAGNTIPIRMSPHDVHVPRTRSRARRLFKRSEEADVENIMLKALDERRPPRAPSRPPGQAEQLRR